MDASCLGRNNEAGRLYRIELSIGISEFNPDNPCSLDHLMSRVDTLMYKDKRIPQGTGHGQDCTPSTLPPLFRPLFITTSPCILASGPGLHHRSNLSFFPARFREEARRL
jgi:GGDEF domain-containing protein